MRTRRIDEITVGERRDVAETRAGTAAGNIHAFDKAEEIAVRVKNTAALEGALIGKLDSQREFAEVYLFKFPHGGDRRSESFQVDTSGNLNREQWCLSFGFAYRTVHRWLDLLDAERYTEKKNAILKRCWELAELWQAANYSSQSNEWFTPAKYIEAVRETLGEIDLDPASSTQANATIRATKIFTQEDDGLVHDWFGRVFMNPPYGKTDEHRSLAAAFCNKAIEQYESGNVEACIILVNSLHSQAWQAPLYDHAFCLVDHRIHFVSADGEENENPTFQNIFVYLGEDVLKFAKVFSRFGYVAKKVACEAAP